MCSLLNKRNLIFKWIYWCLCE